MISEIPGCYVQNMNNKPDREDAEPFKSLEMLDALSNDSSITQRDLSQRLGIALGLVNSYIKNLVAKGYVTVKSIPPKRYAYFLTPKGFAEKTRLTYHLLQDYTRIYRETRGNLKRFFKEMKDAGVKKLVFAGADEVAEIAYMTLQETDMELVAVVDEAEAGKKFFRYGIRPLGSVREMSYDLILVASYLRRNEIFRELLDKGVKEEVIKVIFPL